MREAEVAVGKDCPCHAQNSNLQNPNSGR